MARQWIGLVLGACLAVCASWPARAVEETAREEVDVGATRVSEEALAVQLAVLVCGYDPGPPDGTINPRTQAAIAAFVADRGDSVGISELATRATIMASLFRERYSGYTRADELRFLSLLGGTPDHKATILPSAGWASTTSPSAAPTAAHSLGRRPIAENGDVQGADNDGDGRVEPVFVSGYYRKDGTYVRSHYRAGPRR